MSVKIEIPDLDHLIQRYVAGEPENKLAREAGVNRWTFRRRLLEAGISPRNVSDSMYIRWGSASSAERAAMLTPAHNATRGRTISISEQRAQALGREAAKTNNSTTENILADALRERSLTVTQQRAIDIYNVDITLDEPRIAVEVFGGQWHAYGNHARRFFERTELLLNLGWHVVIIWVDGRRYPLGIGATDYLVALAERLRLNPTVRGQYRVIRGDGSPAPALKTYLNRPADIMRFDCGADPSG